MILPKSNFKNISILVTLTLSLILSCSKNPTDSNNNTSNDLYLNLDVGINEVSVNHKGIRRSTIIHTPISYSLNNKYPVVFVFHGANQTMVDGQSILESIVDENNIIGVYPQGHLNSWNTEAGVDPSNADDVGFVEYLIQLLMDEGIVDSTRLYSIGYSNGGVFNYKLAIETGKFAAICSLAASFFEGMIIPESVPQISVIQIHGDSDFSVPFEGGQSYAIDIKFESAIGTVEKWAVHNNINTEPEILSAFENTSLYLYEEDGNSKEVRLYKLDDTGHNIFSHQYMQSLTAIDQIWTFFSNKHL